ncbi:hypothetical protein LS73_007690 [Helicobacter muridarum]|uniref:Uncharacterized protein n=1 Tax=Helicobacter muridarum TaxID=216 RepID=A0A377PWL2_9HELI|nr:hypothetical protein [Helicobacter muridarum]TLD99139.1 hypothetical protein LS73_007690 [Helicobacter muridarum]STQ86910.1 Uncharacterised protein [Helicobacter muridarum]
MENITAEGLSLSLLQEKGLPHFHIFDIRSTQAFLSAHLQGSFHAKDEREIIESLEYLAGGGGKYLYQASPYRLL